MPFFLFLLLLLLPFQAFSANNLEFCGEGRQPSFTFREVYVDHLDPSKRTQELWMDPADDALRGFWRRKDKPPVVLIGNATEKGRFFLCEYALGKEKAQKLYFGEKQREEITFSGLKLKRLHHLPEARDYMLRYDLRTLVHDDPKFVDTIRCQALYAFFQIEGTKLSPGQMVLNTEIMDELKYGIAIDAEAKDCLTRTTLPRRYNFAANVLYADSRFISYKIDSVQMVQGKSEFSTKSSIFDLKDQRHVDHDELFSKADRNKLYKFVKKHLQEMPGADDRLDDLEGVSFAFTAETLVINLYPFVTASIPVTLDTVERVLKIQLRGPLSSPNPDSDRRK